MDRILQGSSAPITVTLLAGSVPTDPSPDSATVTVTRADGTAVVTAQAATGTGVGTFSFTLTPMQTALLDVLTATWTFTSGGQLQSRQTRHEVVGGFLCTLQELKTVLSTLDDATLAARRVDVEQELEKALGYACVPRYVMETRYARDGVVTTRSPLRDVRSLSVTRAGVTTLWATDQVTALTLESWGVCGVWCNGPVALGYEHGLDFPDEDIREAALLLAAEAYGPNAVDGRIVQTQADSMMVQYASPLAGGPFVGARLNQIVNANRLPAIA